MAEREGPEPPPPSLRPLTPTNSSARHLSPPRRTLRRLHHKVPGFSTLAARSSGPPTHQPPLPPPPPPPPLLTPPAWDPMPCHLQQRPNPPSRTETARTKAQDGVKTPHRAAKVGGGSEGGDRKGRHAAGRRGGKRLLHTVSTRRLFLHRKETKPLDVESGGRGGWGGGCSHKLFLFKDFSESQTVTQEPTDT